MTRLKFNPATCSWQDWGTRLAVIDAHLLALGGTRSQINDRYAEFSGNLHEAMGHRPDQPEF